MNLQRHAKRKELEPTYAGSVTDARQKLDVHSIQHLGKDELLRIQGALGMGNRWGYWTVPEKWMPNTRPTDRTVSIAQNSSLADQAWLEVIRVLLVMTMTLGANGRFLSPATVASYGRRLCKLSLRCAELKEFGNGWWSRVTAQECQTLLKKAARNILAQFGHLYAGGLIADQPRSRPMDLGPRERDRFGDPEVFFDPKEKRTWQPLPDQFTSECGKRVLWFIKVLGPQILDCLEACNAVLGEPRPGVSRTFDKLTPESRRQIVGRLRTEMVRGWDWRDSGGGPLLSLPFCLNLKTRVNEPRVAKKEGRDVFEPFRWPPRTWGDLIALVTTLQTCHAWVLLLASGPRNSTVISYEVDSLKAGIDGPRIEGLQRKKQGVWGGQIRDWPLPPRLAVAFNQQVRLAESIRGLASPNNPDKLGQHLWVQTGKGGKGSVGSKLLNFNASLDALVDTFGLRELLGSEFPRLHSHRFRKTLARVIALALTSAQTVLMDTFGHDDPDVTLGYMLSDKTVVADALEVQRELVILMAVDAINDSERVGGPVGDRLREAKNRFLRITGKSRLEPTDVYELADKETFGGRTWRQVMPGVICTISQFDAGPCGRGKGVRTDPSNCQAGCSHQLLLAEHMNRSDENIADMLALLQRAIDDENDMLVATIAPQIANEVCRWELVFEKWRSHPLIQKFCQMSGSPYWSNSEAKA